MTPQEVMARFLTTVARDSDAMARRLDAKYGRDCVTLDQVSNEMVADMIAALEAAGFRVLPVGANEVMQSAGEAVALQARAGPNDRADCGQIYVAMCAAYRPEDPA